MWKTFVKIIKKHGVLNVNFKRFMVDYAKSNFNTVRILFGSGDMKILMENWEHTCFYYWTQSFDWHIKKLICPEFRNKHIKVCHDYKNATTLASTKAKYQAIRVWWLSSSATFENNIHELNDWLAFWHFCYPQWRGYARVASFLLFLLIVQLSLIFSYLFMFWNCIFPNVM
jgi:hypothetical protein